MWLKRNIDFYIYFGIILLAENLCVKNRKKLKYQRYKSREGSSLFKLWFELQ